MTPKDTRSHKEQYRQEHFKHLMDLVSIKMDEVTRALYRLRNVDIEFEEWYKSRFPDGE